MFFMQLCFSFSKNKFLIRQRPRQQAQLLKGGTFLKTKMLIREMAQKNPKLKLRHTKRAHHTFLSYPRNISHSKSRLSTHFLTNGLRLLRYKKGIPRSRYLEGLVDPWATVFQY